MTCSALKAGFFVIIFVRFLLYVLFCINGDRTFYTDSSGKGLFFRGCWGGWRVLFKTFYVHNNGTSRLVSAWDELHFASLSSPSHLGLLPSPPSVTSPKAHVIPYPHAFCHVSFFDWIKTMFGRREMKGWIEFCRYAWRRHSFFMQISPFLHPGGGCGKQLPWFFPSFFCGNHTGLCASLCLCITSCMQYHIQLQLYGKYSRFYLPQQAWYGFNNRTPRSSLDGLQLCTLKSATLWEVGLWLQNFSVIPLGVLW